MAKQDFIIEEFKKYKVFLYGGTSVASYDYSIHIKLKAGLAIIRFKNGKLKKNKSSKIGKNTLYEVYCNSERYLAFIDVLRNEKPLFFYYHQKNNASYITTSDEPVGENE